MRGELQRIPESVGAQLGRVRIISRESSGRVLSPESPLGESSWRVLWAVLWGNPRNVHVHLAP